MEHPFLTLKSREPQKPGDARPTAKCPMSFSTEELAGAG
jgi:hypothetical protein